MKALTRPGGPLPINVNIQRHLSDPRVLGMLSRHLGADDRARKLVLRVAREAHANPEIEKCHPVSIAAAVLAIAEEKLELGTEVYLIPRWDKRIGTKALYAQTSYLGEMARVRRATQGRAVVRCAIIRQGDEFSVEPHADYPITHRVAWELDLQLGQGEVREPVGAWAAIIEDGRWNAPAVMTKQQLLDHRDQYTVKNKAGEIPRDNIWNTDPEAAYLKTVIRRSSKLVGRGGLLSEIEDRQETLEDQIIEAYQPPPPAQNGPEAAHAALEVAERVLGTDEG